MIRRLGLAERENRPGLLIVRPSVAHMSSLRVSGHSGRNRGGSLARTVPAAAATIDLVTSCSSSSDAEKRESGPTVGSFTRDEAWMS